jgi:hypothetical protein
MMNEIVGRITGRKRAAIILIGAVSGLIVAVMFAAFAHQSVAPIELIIGAAIGGLLGLSASLGEARRKRPEK